MPNYTTNINLEKPLQTENYDIAVHNSNYDKIDTVVGAINTGKSDALVAGDNIILEPNAATKTVKVSVSDNVLNPMNIWKANKSYTVGEVVRSGNLPSWALAVCVTAGTTGATEPSWSGATVGQVFPNDGGVTWQVSDIKLMQKTIGELAKKQNNIQYIQVQDEKPSGTAGGTFANGAWRTRVINTIKHDDTGQVVLSNNQVTLPSGTYSYQIIAATGDGQSTKCRLYNITDSQEIGAGMNTNAEVGVMQNSICFGKFTIQAGKALEVQHYATGSPAGTFGSAASISGVPEIYLKFMLWRVG